MFSTFQTHSVLRYVWIRVTMHFFMEKWSSFWPDSNFLKCLDGVGVVYESLSVWPFAKTWVRWGGSSISAVARMSRVSPDCGVGIGINTTVWWHRKQVLGWGPQCSSALSTIALQRGMGTHRLEEGVWSGSFNQWKSLETFQSLFWSTLLFSYLIIKYLY